MDDQKNPQTSLKEGVASSSKKQKASRPGSGDSPRNKPVPGAHGDPATSKGSRGSANHLTDGTPGDPDLE
jgi:hypothetical protein